MKILAFILSIIVATALLIGGVFLIIFTAPKHLGTGLTLTATTALTILIYGPLLLGSLTTYWDLRTSSESRRYYSRWLWITIALEALAAVALVIFVLLAPAPIWVAVLFIVVSAALTLVAPMIGRALLRYDLTRHPDVEASTTWTPVTRSEIATKIRKVAITFVVAVVVSGAGLTLQSGLLSDSGVDIADVLFFTFDFACIVAGFACILVTLPLNRRLRDIVTRDISQMRKITRVVLRKKSDVLNEAESVAAVKYSVIMPTILAFTLAYFSLLYLGIGSSQVRNIVAGDDADGLAPILVGVYVVLFFVIVPLYGVRIRRARRYARHHADLLPTANPAQLLAETDR